MLVDLDFALHIRKPIEISKPSLSIILRVFHRNFSACNVSLHLVPTVVYGAQAYILVECDNFAQNSSVIKCRPQNVMAGRSEYGDQFFHCLFVNEHGDVVSLWNQE